MAFASARDASRPATCRSSDAWRSRSSRTTSSGPSSGRNDSAASNCGYSLAGVRTRSVSQSMASVAPESVIR